MHRDTQISLIAAFVLEGFSFNMSASQGFGPQRNIVFNFVNFVVFFLIAQGVMTAYRKVTTKRAP